MEIGECLQTRTRIVKVTEFLKLCQDGTNREICAKEVCGKIKILYCNVCGTFNVVMIYHLIFL